MNTLDIVWCTSAAGVIVFALLSEMYSKTIFTVLKVISLIIFFGCIGYIAWTSPSPDSWNNGKCVCGGNWEFTREKEESHLRPAGKTMIRTHNTVYIYECDYCEKFLELGERVD